VINVQLRGDKRIREALRHAEGKLSDMGGLMRSLANLQYQSTVRNFEKESFDGEKWPELAESTQHSMITEGSERGAANILRPTGRHIFQRISQSSTRDEARVKCNQGWAFAHNFGIPMPQGWQMPQRTFLGISDEDEESIANAIDAYVERALSQ